VADQEGGFCSQCDGVAHCTCQQPDAVYHAVQKVAAACSRVAAGWVQLCPIGTLAVCARVATNTSRCLCGCASQYAVLAILVLALVDVSLELYC
jgi:Na+/H+-dicarboxylate symporter